MENCILCHDSSVESIEEISSQHIVSLYKTRAKLDVSGYFKVPTIHLLECRNCGLKFFTPQITGDGKFYDELQKNPAYYLSEKAEFHEAATYVNANDKVLEVGCGEGLFTKYIKYQSYTGLEFSNDAIKSARANGLNVIGEALETHARSHAGAYDVVCYFQVLEHVSNPHQFVADSLKCLRPGGKLILAVPSEDSFLSGVVNMYLNMPPHHISRWPDRTFRQMAKLFNLQLTALYHEPLHQVHTSFYIRTKIYSQIQSAAGHRFRNVDRSAFNEMFFRVSYLLSRLVAPFFRQKNVIGQSVMAVFTK